MRQYEDLQATYLYCNHCSGSMPVREKLLLIHSTAPNLALQGEVQKRRSVSTLSKPRALARGASNGLILPDGYLFEYLCTNCGQVVGDKKTKLKPQDRLRF